MIFVKHIFTLKNYKMKRIMILMALIFATSSLFSQTKDTKATQLLDQVSEKTKASKSIKADFSYSIDNKQGNVHDVKTGTLMLSGDKYRLSTGGQTVISDGKTIWTYIKQSNEVQVNDLDLKDESLTPSKLLTSYNQNYKARIVKDKTTDANSEAIELIPNNTKNFTKAIIVVDKNKKEVKSFSLYDKNGNVFTYKITNYQTNVPVTPADFTFDAKKYPGVEVIDMR